MASYAINNLTAPDEYQQVSTLGPLSPVDHINIDVANNAVYWQIQQVNDLVPNPAGGDWNGEVFMSVGSRSISRRGLVGFRFRAAVPAADIPAGQLQAQVTVEAVIS